MIIVKNRNSPPGGLFERGAYFAKLILTLGINREGGLFETGGLFDHLRYISRGLFSLLYAYISYYSFLLFFLLFFNQFFSLIMLIKKWVYSRVQNKRIIKFSKKSHLFVKSNLYQVGLPPCLYGLKYLYSQLSISRTVKKPWNLFESSTYRVVIWTDCFVGDIESPTYRVFETV